VCAFQKVDEKQTSQREMVAEEGRNLLGIKELNKRETLELASFHMKFLKDSLPKMVLKAFVTSIYSTTQSI
jgi:hypothetical protein